METDSKNYGVLKDAVRLIKDIPGLTCEIGLRCGGGSEYIIDTLYETRQNRTHIAIDPYGGLPYYEKEDKLRPGPDGPYSNVMMEKTLVVMYRYIQDRPNVNFLFFPLEDNEFYKRFGDGVPVYRNGKKKIMSEYALVHFDGPHTLKDTLEETEFFAVRAPVGAIFVYDDVKGYYDHHSVQQWLLNNGWKIVRTTNHKNSYKKIM